MKAEGERRKAEAAAAGKRLVSGLVKLVAVVAVAGLAVSLISSALIYYARYQARRPIEPEMVQINGGSFQMGSPAGEKDRGDDEKQHRVSIAGFYIAKTEVTFAQYDRFAKATGRAKPEDQSWGRGERPVINVSWDDAVAYADWLSNKTGKQYRLPTEAEWEGACRAGGQDRYCGGNDLDALAWRFDNSVRPTQPVGGKLANAWGLHDMTGNVLEWTCSAYDKDYGGGEKQCASMNDTTINRVLRGGSWSDGTRGARAASRSNGYSPGNRYNYIGFRLARTVSP